MQVNELRSHVARLFPNLGPRRTRVAVEHELLVAEVGSDATVPVARTRRAVARDPSAIHVSFEPGGQLELSLPPVATPSAAGRLLRVTTDVLRRRLDAHDIRLISHPVDSRPDVPLRLTTPRYVAMQRHLDTIGPAGRRMMRRTAATQVCLDWWPGAAGIEQWRLLQLAGPFLAAAFARSSGPTGRLATWLAVDPERTAYDDRLLHGGDPVAAYASFAAGAAVFTTGGPAEHLSTLFPPVRPRGRYLEVRYLDVQEEHRVGTVIAALAALVYDDVRRHRALRLLEPEGARLAELWRAAASGDPWVAARGRELATGHERELVA